MVVELISSYYFTLWMFSQMTSLNYTLCILPNFHPNTIHYGFLPKLYPNTTDTVDFNPNFNTSTGTIHVDFGPNFFVSLQHGLYVSCTLC